jgi:hypothetical protein
MSHQEYQTPKFRNIFIGFVIFVSLLTALWNLDSVIKQTGDFLIFIPSKMGLVQRITPEEIKVCDSEFTIDITKPGKYFIYAGFKSTIPFRLETNNVVSVAIKSQTKDEQINVFTVGRGIRLYDTPLAKGRPFFKFEISAPDKYDVLFYRNSFSNEGVFTIVPDYTTGKETVFSLAFGIQIAILIVLFGIFYYPVYKRKQVRIKNITVNQKQRQIKGQAFWQEEIQRANRENPKDDK